MRLTIRSASCTGHGRCYSVAPELFDCDDDGFGVVRASQIGDEALADARRAVECCPERAVRLDGAPAAIVEATTVTES